MKIVQYHPTFNRGLPLVTEIRQMKKPTVEKVRELYGDFGVDLFEGKQPSLIKETPKSKNPVINIVNKVKDYFSKKAEFEPDDSMFRIVHKYIFNEKAGLVKDIETKFGKSGKRILEGMERMGYVE